MDYSIFQNKQEKSRKNHAFELRPERKWAWGMYMNHHQNQGTYSLNEGLLCLDPAVNRKPSLHNIIIIENVLYD